MPRLCVALLAAALLPLAVTSSAAEATPPPVAGKYRSFAVAIYIPAPAVKTFADEAVLTREWTRISHQLKVDKVYIEPYRDGLLLDAALLERTKRFFVEHGVRVAGGITLTDTPAGGLFRSFCYTDPTHRARVKQIIELTAGLFDEVILDDFFFVTTKLESDIAAKGTRSWTEFRLELLREAGRELIVKAAKAVNPQVKVIIKYPNWYEHFAAMGFDLAAGPAIFDGIYTGTETRDPSNTDQYLQPYESYQIVRYFENIAPGRNGGGWVDPFASLYADRYAEQLWDTMFAKAREMTLFEWSSLLRPAMPGARQAWAAQATSFNYEAMTRYAPPGADPALAGEPTVARIAGCALDQVDGLVAQLGQPIGIASYRPPHATGEDFLHNYLGMLGIPIDLRATFPEDAAVVLLTEDAKGDPEIVARIKRHLLAGKSVVITSGLLTALQGRGIEDIAEFEVSGRRFLADGYATGLFGGTSRADLANAKTGAPAILFPQIGYVTNDAWPLVTAMADGVGYPLLLSDRYGATGQLFVWTMPDNFRQLYRLPPAVTTAIKNIVMKGFPVRIDGPAEVALFTYDNRTLVVESYRDEPVTIRVGTLGGTKLRELTGGATIEGRPPETPKPRWAPPTEARTWFEVTLAPHSHRGFAIE